MNSSDRLANLRDKGILAPYETADLNEIKVHMDAAKGYLADAQNKTNSNLTRFMVAYSAGHSFLTAALKMAGYRTTSDKGHRALLYDILDALLPGAAGAKETLSRAHIARNRADYEGELFDPTEGLIDDLVDAVKDVEEEANFNYKKFKAARQSQKN